MLGTAGGDGYDLYPVTFPTKRGGLAMALCPTNIDQASVTIYHREPYPVLGGIGYEIAFSPPPNFSCIRLQATLFDGTTQVDYLAKYDHLTGKVYIYDDAGNYQEVGNPGIQNEVSGNFCAMKLVFDCINGEYVRVIFNDHEYDASGHSAWSESDNEARHMRILIKACVNGANKIKVVVDDVIITQNEPT